MEQAREMNIRSKRMGRLQCVFGAVVLAMALPAPGRGQAPTRYELADLKALEEAFVKVAAKVRPAVVAIRTYQTRRPDDTETVVRIPHSQGSGLIIDSAGLIATNAHVIEGGESILVVLHDGTRADGTVVATDERSDLAVIKIDVPNLPVANWGDANKLRVNQWIFACGNPFGLANEDGRTSVTYGVVSALDRQMTDRLEGGDFNRYYGHLIETSAALNPGSSGGPLFNIDGEVVGIVAAIATSSGVNEGHGFAIAVDKEIRAVLDTLKSGRSFRYGYLGVSVDDLEPPDSRRVADMGMPRGARITRVDPPDSPAARAGLKPNDVIIEFNGAPISNKDHLVRMVGFTPVGSEASITYLRKQVKRNTTVILADRRDAIPANPVP